MRRFVFTLLLCLAVPAAALAAPQDRGDGALVVEGAKGMVTIAGSGTVLGRVGDGAVTITDRDPADTAVPEVFGADRDGLDQRNATTTVYKGKGLRFRFIGAQRYKIAIVGADIDISARGRGRVSLIGGDETGNGQFSIDGGGFLSVPSTLFAAAFGQPSLPVVRSASGSGPVR